VSNGRVHDFTPDRRFFVRGIPFGGKFGKLDLPASAETRLSAVGDDTFRLSHIAIERTGLSSTMMPGFLLRDAGQIFGFWPRES
jgi:hypothetical protein